MSAPEAVRDEVLRKSRTESRFKAGGQVWRKLEPRYMEVLSDDVTDELATAVNRISGMPVERRIRRSEDLGEVMVIAHAVVMAEGGNDVYVLIDDGGGRKLAGSEARRLDRLRRAGRKVGAIWLVGTVTVLEKAAGSEYLPDRGAMRDLYQRLRGLDDGLPPLDQTQLMVLPCWP
ncbi:hypothetical protein [Tessaracoccus sp. MC1627]|uniref:hypothetical protein n=1 Tax=Tessaracoccus sp. MC1627 TaxID=2760312 RepID=UPI001C725797|nr:hypothetical protein [Tessaracoccus sp. MC1627]